MPASEARILANRMNAQRSTGPVTPEGKQRSRRNGLKHGLTGAGVVVPEEDQGEVDRLAGVLLAEMAPKTQLGATLVLTIAKLSVRMDRGCRHETASIAARVRHAVEDFDEARLDLAERLFDELGDDPRVNLRKLRKMPEGVDRLVVAWGELRADLTRSPRPLWTASHLEKAANLTGLRIDDAYGTRLGVLSKAAWTDFAALADHEGGHLDEEARQGWARARLAERIDAEVAALEIHRDSLDTDPIELDRLEAPGRALFDPSKEAALARRYEAEAQRGFFRALKEYRQVEAEAAAKAEAGADAVAAVHGPAPRPVREPSGPSPAVGVEALASSWEAPEVRPGESFAAYRERAMLLDAAARVAEGRPSGVARAR